MALPVERGPVQSVRSEQTMQVKIDELIGKIKEAKDEKQKEFIRELINLKADPKAIKSSAKKQLNHTPAYKEIRKILKTSQTSKENLQNQGEKPAQPLSRHRATTTEGEKLPTRVTATVTREPEEPDLYHGKCHSLPPRRCR